MPFPNNGGIQHEMVQIFRLFLLMNELAIKSVVSQKPMLIHTRTSKKIHPKKYDDPVKTLLHALIMKHPILCTTTMDSLKAYAVWLAVTFSNLHKSNTFSEQFIYEYGEIDGRSGTENLVNYVEQAFSGDVSLTKGSLWHSFIEQYCDAKYRKTLFYARLEKWVNKFDQFVRTI